MTTFLTIILVLALFFCVLLFMIAPKRPTAERIVPYMHTYVAHRGLFTIDQKIPENSLAAFQNAVNHGFGVELDVQLTKDRQVVVFHDAELKRACGIDGRVDSFTYEELLERARLFGTEEKIPLFTEVLAVLDGRVPVIVELKRGGEWVKNCKLTYEILCGYTGEFCVESFDYKIVRWFYKHAPTIMRGQLSENYTGRKDLGPVKAFIATNLLTNFLTRPQFIAYGNKGVKQEKPLLVRLCEKMGALRVMWTDKPGHDQEWLKERYDCLIFQHFDTPVHYE